MSASKVEITYTPEQEHTLRSIIADLYGQSGLLGQIDLACQEHGLYPTAEARLDVALVHLEEMILLRLVEGEVMTGALIDTATVDSYLNGIFLDIFNNIGKKLEAIKKNEEQYNKMIARITSDIYSWKSTYGEKRAKAKESEAENATDGEGK